MALLGIAVTPCQCGHGERAHAISLADHARSSCTECGCPRFAPACEDGEASC